MSAAPRYAYTYIISKRLDPLFAVSIGIAAAGVRVQREEKEKGRSTEETLQSLRRRIGIAGDEAKKTLGMVSGS
ncbi:hypothetical protein K402DRAFT_417443 [Aulographum hederae CBS 113979]|uniref:Non-classical export protein 1 n=1 Tax=Aulographum hederae CBS 113979 TaxID=1176131 RepID=A0A6G1HC79_9PEZI|nr:hypothetical protein K402DRAFT_417443 [Aulographum hederae CBS 113979]